MRFEWDEEKNAANQRKHGVPFEEASQVLGEESTLEIFDAEHSDFEDRFISIGSVRRGIILVVWTEREEEVIRIISARWATRHEVDLYHQYIEKQHE